MPRERGEDTPHDFDIDDVTRPAQPPEDDRELVALVRLQRELDDLREAFGPLAASGPPLGLIDAELRWLRATGRIEQWRRHRFCLTCGFPSDSSSFERDGEQGVLCRRCADLHLEAGREFLPNLIGALGFFRRPRGRPKDEVASPEFLALYAAARKTALARGWKPKSMEYIAHLMNLELPPERQLTRRTLQEKLKRYGLK